ncbi:MAG TPA: TIGR03936 family radical SAM-associated protein, partial [Thermoanaerobaculia bacterium]|nr:TIGR03936 family radical SAM-associated protein [Thermoanaerobaculia bacterium]
LARPLPKDFSFASLPTLPAVPGDDGASGEQHFFNEERKPPEAREASPAKQAAYRARSIPDLPPLRERRRVGDGSAAPVPETARTYRVSFQKLGDARYLSHRNVMDVLERAFRAARAPIRYTEGYNPHIRMSMGPALPLGQESRHELFDVDVTEALTDAQVAAVNDRLPSGVRITGRTELPKGSRSLGKAATEAVYRFVLPNGEARVERLKIAGEGSTTPRRFLESTYGLAPEDQHDIRVVREETVLTA